MRAIVRFLGIQFRLKKVTRAQLESMVDVSITREEFWEICGREAL